MSNVQDRFRALKFNGVKLAELPNCLAVMGLHAELAMHFADRKWTDAMDFCKVSTITEIIPFGSPPVVAPIQMDVTMEVLTQCYRHLSSTKREGPEVVRKLESMFQQMQDMTDPVTNIT